MIIKILNNQNYGPADHINKEFQAFWSPDKKRLGYWAQDDGEQCVAWYIDKENCEIIEEDQNEKVDHIGKASPLREIFGQYLAELNVKFK